MRILHVKPICFIIHKRTQTYKCVKVLSNEARGHPSAAGSSVAWGGRVHTEVIALNHNK